MTTFWPQGNYLSLAYSFSFRSVGLSRRRPGACGVSGHQLSVALHRVLIPYLPGYRENGEMLGEGRKPGNFLFCFEIFGVMRVC